VSYRDLAHDVCIKLITNRDKCKEIEQQGKLKPYIYVVTKNEFLSSKAKEELINFDNSIIAEPNEVNYKKQLEDLINEKDLPFIDRLWLDAFLTRDLNASWVESSLNIGRHCAKDRLNDIIERLK
jgi:DNA-directed RNA polymerase specialized sigma24 family protein